MTDKYKNFKHLSLYENKGEDFEIEKRSRDSVIAIMAPHGGMIEPYSAPIAKLITGNDFSFYAFKGIKKKGTNTFLHITSHHFDEPDALAIARHADIVVAVHGKKNHEEPFAMVGGRHHLLCGNIKENIKKAGFKVKTPDHHTAAKHPLNICNQGNLKQGVQLELSATLRKELKSDRLKEQRFVDAIRAALFSYTKNK